MRKPSSGIAVRALLLGGAVVVVAVTAVARGLSPADLGLVWPSWRETVLWLAFWAAWMAVTEVAGRRLGLPAPEPWPAQPARDLVLRAAVIIVLAPLAEELVFRGLLFGRLEDAIGVVAAVLITAALFSVMHLQYRHTQLVLVFLDGLVFGVARASTGSVLLTALLHAVGNALAVYQRRPRRATDE